MIKDMHTLKERETCCSYVIYLILIKFFYKTVWLNRNMWTYYVKQNLSLYAQ